MSRTPLLLVSAALLFGLAPGQDRRTRRPKPSPPKASRLVHKKKLADMQGVWRLVEMKLSDENVDGMADLSMEQVGYCLVSGRHLSIEFHIRLLDKEGDTGRSFVSGMHRFEFDESGDLETSTLIGIRTDQRGGPEFEPAGTKRHYSCGIEDGTMTLVRDDGHTLVFERLLDDESRYDIFGRPVTETDEDPEAGKVEGENKDKHEEDGEEDGDR